MAKIPEQMKKKLLINHIHFFIIRQMLLIYKYDEKNL